MFPLLAVLLACTAAKDDTATEPPRAAVGWTHERPPLAETTSDGRSWKRAIVHLHSPLSHDACDDHELDDASCLADLRDGLCADAIDVAFVTDHPSTAAEHPYEDLFNLQDGDVTLAADGTPAATGFVASRMGCASGHAVTTLPGIEDELMPVGLDRHVGDTAEENDRIYNDTGEESLSASIAAGAVPLQAHTEGKTLEELLERQALGQAGTEIFNLHAMVDPTKREEDLGLEALAYMTEAGPFISGQTTAEPDLVFLAIYQEQTVSLERWDALNAVAPSLGTGGTDAHENALPMLMTDGERVDSYRRMMAWFANYLVVSDDSPASYEGALRERQGFVVFDVLGVPSGFEAAYGTATFAADAPVGEALSVTCPTVALPSPWDGDEPEIDVTVYKDGAQWRSGCGSFAISDPGVYRVRVDIVPHHLSDFLGDQADALVHPYPWIYSQAFRVGL